MSDDDKIVDIRKFATNLVGRRMHQPMNEYQIMDLLEEQGDNWRIIWESIPTHATFDLIYAKSAMYDAFVYEGMLFERRRKIDDPSEGYYWEAPHSDLLHWVIDHPPFDACVTVADLFTYSQGIGEDKQPIVLFALIIGLAELSEDMTTIKPLFGVGPEDAVYLGRALEAWGDYGDVVTPYTDLLFEFAAQEHNDL